MDKISNILVQVLSQKKHDALNVYTVLLAILFQSFSIRIK